MERRDVSAAISIGMSSSKKRQRLAVAVETEAGVDAAFEHVVEHEIERREFRQIVANDARRLARREDLGDALGRHLRRHRRIVRRIAADQRDVESIALVAGARIGDFVQADRPRHAGAPDMVTRGSANLRSIRHEALASRGVRRLRTPAPPAGPAQ